MSSSSITSSSSIHQGKLLVHIAENGHSFELECNETTTVDEVMQCFGQHSGITFNDQLVLCLHMKLEPKRPLSAYKPGAAHGGRRSGRGYGVMSLVLGFVQVGYDCDTWVWRF